MYCLFDIVIALLLLLLLLLPAICVRDLEFISGFNDVEVKQK